MIADRNKAAGEKSLAALEDLLEWSRLQIVGATLTARAVPVAPLVQSCIQAAADLAAEKKVRLATDEIAPSLTAFADERAIRVVLRNLIGNALKFTGEGGQVRIRAWQADGAVFLSVKDSGTGIPEDKLRQLLSLGATSSTRGVRGETGTGFGLAMCKDIVTRFHGRLTATSIVGEGSEFRLRLPCSEPERLAAE